MYFRSCVVYKLLFRSALSFFIWFLSMHKIWLSKKKRKYFSLKILSFSYFLMKSSLLKWGKYRIKRSIYFAMFRQKFLFKRFFVIFINILTNLIIVFCILQLCLWSFVRCISWRFAVQPGKSGLWSDVHMHLTSRLHVFSMLSRLETVRHYSPCLCQIRLIKFDCCF